MVQLTLLGNGEHVEDDKDHELRLEFHQHGICKARPILAVPQFLITWNAAISLQNPFRCEADFPTATLWIGDDWRSLLVGKDPIASVRAETDDEEPEAVSGSHNGHS